MCEDETSLFLGLPHCGLLEGFAILSITSWKTDITGITVFRVVGSLDEEYFQLVLRNMSENHGYCVLHLCIIFRRDGEL
jgi:hypothetical protein